MTFQLPELPYSYDALEPHIDARTMEIHHSKHHAGYTNKLNVALEGTGWEEKSIEDILQNTDQFQSTKSETVRNNGGGYYNHCLYRESMTPEKQTVSESFKTELIGYFGSFDTFKERFSSFAASRFGSGRAWLVLESDNSLNIISTPNQDSPIMEGKTPLLGIDVREHAYYLHYQNKRADYITARWNIVNWKKVEERYEVAKG